MFLGDTNTKRMVPLLNQASYDPVTVSSTWAECREPGSIIELWNQHKGPSIEVLSLYLDTSKTQRILKINLPGSDSSAFLVHQLIESAYAT